MTLLDEILSRTGFHLSNCRCKICTQKPHQANCQCKSCQPWKTRYISPHRRRKQKWRQFKRFGFSAIKEAIAKGIRNENRLTDLLFFQRHPELPQGYDIRTGDERYRREWMHIRKRIVRPLLGTLKNNKRDGYPIIRMDHSK